MCEERGIGVQQLYNHSRRGRAADGLIVADKVSNSQTVSDLDADDHSYAGAQPLAFQVAGAFANRNTDVGADSETIALAVGEPEAVDNYSADPNERTNSDTNDDALS